MDCAGTFVEILFLQISFISVFNKTSASFMKCQQNNLGASMHASFSVLYFTDSYLSSLCYAFFILICTKWAYMKLTVKLPISL